MEKNRLGTTFLKRRSLRPMENHIWRDNLISPYKTCGGLFHGITFENTYWEKGKRLKTKGIF